VYQDQGFAAAALQIMKRSFVMFKKRHFARPIASDEFFFADTYL